MLRSSPDQAREVLCKKKLYDNKELDYGYMLKIMMQIYVLI